MDIANLLSFIDPASLDYSGWLAVGMAIHHEGGSVQDWENWSMRDSGRYHRGECARKWQGFSSHSGGITGASLVALAKQGGWRGGGDDELDFNDTIHDDCVIVSRNRIQVREFEIPEDWNPAGQLIAYLETLFDANDKVGYVTRTFERDGRLLPTKGCFDRTAGQLIAELSRCNGDIGSVLGDYNPDAGAWIRFNPLDGAGVQNSNVTDYRFALVESDSMELEMQHSILRELELPIAALVYSGGKSLHAIVRIEAATYEEYRKRVDYLYAVCQKNGLDLDRQNRNPSRLSRMPGVTRRGEKQYLLCTNIGKGSWDEWRDWIEAVTDDLPEPESIEAVWHSLPELAPPLIENILRQGHKMLLSGPSKAGKSFALIELCICLAEGKPWLGFDCAKGRVLYVNLELDRASCLHRFKDVYEALGYTPENLGNIDIWNLRGRSVPMDKLAPKLIRRAAKKNYIAIIVDPIYKVITGDENSADQMAHFCNQFDRICTELGCAVIYCHHHSKGAQGGKRSMDRASGSGFFARDPDALLDLIELSVSENCRKQELNNALCRLCLKYLESQDVSQDEACSSSILLEICRDRLSLQARDRLHEEVMRLQTESDTLSAWRIEGTLREFPKFRPINLWFDYPVHRIDKSGILQDMPAQSDGAPTYRRTEKQHSQPDRKAIRKEKLAMAFAACEENGKASVRDVAEYMGVSTETVKNYVSEHSAFRRDSGYICRADNTD